MRNRFIISELIRYFCNHGINEPFVVLAADSRNYFRILSTVNCDFSTHDNLIFYCFFSLYSMSFDAFLIVTFVLRILFRSFVTYFFLSKIALRNLRQTDKQGTKITDLRVDFYNSHTCVWWYDVIKIIVFKTVIVTTERNVLINQT